MKLLSLFSGIGAFEKALERLDIKYELVNYCEIGKYASKSYAAIHGVDENMNLGDVTKVDTSKLPNDIDLISHGSPCQDFSLAGKQAGGEKGSGTRSSLLYETVRIVADTKPKVVLWENVKNVLSKKHKPVFDNYIYEMDLLGYNSYYKVLNAKEFAIPQNRERVFTVSIRKDIDPGTFEFPKPMELFIRLKDMLEDEVDEKYYLSDEKISSILNWKAYQKPFERVLGKQSIAPTLTARGAGEEHSGMILYSDGLEDSTNLQEQLLIKEKTKKGYAEANEGDGVYINRPHQKRGVVQKGMIQTTKTGCDVGVVVKDKSLFTDTQTKMITPDGNIKRYVNSDVVDEFKEGQIADISFPNGYNKGCRVHDECPAINTTTTTASSFITKITQQPLRIRKLTPKECFRLMGFGDEDFEKAASVNSNTQLYKQAGNSIVVDVLVHIFRQLFEVIDLRKKEEEMKKNEFNLIMGETNKMFDLEKLKAKEPNLFDELVKKYPLKKCVYLIKNLNEEESKQVEEVTSIEEYCKRDVELTQQAVEVVAEASKEDVKAFVEEALKPQQELVFPEDFQPLFNIGEKLTIQYQNGEVVEAVTIVGITPKIVNDEIVDYYYGIASDQTGEVKEMAEQWLIDHEVVNNAA